MQHEYARYRYNVFCGSVCHLVRLVGGRGICGSVLEGGVEGGLLGGVVGGKFCACCIGPGVPLGMSLPGGRPGHGDHGFGLCRRVFVGFQAVRGGSWHGICPRGP